MTPEIALSVPELHVLLVAHRNEFLAECDLQGVRDDDALEMLADFERAHLAHLAQSPQEPA